MKYDVLKLNTIPEGGVTQDGVLYFEAEKDLPFQIRRLYYIFNTKEGMHRGFHAHKLNWQLLFCPTGSIEIVLDDGKERESVMLDEPSKGLILHPGLWREMVWHADDSVLCVAASEYYDADEYIRDYDQFLQYIKRATGDQENEV